MAHERTMPGPKLTRMALRSTAGADISPLMAFVPDRSWRLSRLFGQARTQPVLDEGIDPSGDSHTVRRINDPEMVASNLGGLRRRAALHRRRASPIRIGARNDRSASRFA